MLEVCDATTGRRILTFKAHSSWIWGLKFSPDGRHLASASNDRTVKVWDAATGQHISTFEGQGMVQCDVAYSPDGRRLALMGFEGPEVWDMASGQRLFTLKGDLAFGLGYSPDGRRLATAGDDRIVKVWDAETGQELLSLKGHRGWVFSVAFSPDGRHLASASQDQTVKIWDATPPTPQRLIEREARGLVQFLIAKPLPPEEAAATIRHDSTISEAVRQQALAWVEPYWRSQIHYEAVRFIAPLFARPMLRSEVAAAIRADASLRKAVRQEALVLAETFPENAPLLNETSWVIVSRPGADAAAYERALHLAQAACRAAPDFAGYINTLGVAYYRIGKYQEAIVALEKSLPGDAANGQDARDLYFLAMCHYRLGNTAQAREYFGRARDSHQRNAARTPRPEAEPEAEQFKRFRTEAELLLAKPAASAERPRDTAP